MNWVRLQLEDIHLLNNPTVHQVRQDSLIFVQFAAAFLNQSDDRRVLQSYILTHWNVLSFYRTYKLKFEV